METSSESDSVPKPDNRRLSQDEPSQNTLASSRRLFTIETSANSELSDFNNEDDTQNSQNHEAELLSSLSLPQTPEGTDGVSEFPTRKSTLNELDIMVYSILINPKSLYRGYVPPLPICTERAAVQELLQSATRQDTSPMAGKERDSVPPDEDDFVEFELTEFAIYLPPNHSHPYELRGLQDFASKSGHSCMLFDGILCAGSQRRYVQAVPFEICSIGNYGKDVHTLGGDIWIQSSFNKKSDLFYRLKSPSSEYTRFHHDFLWLADFAKHFVDYCEACEEQERAVSVHNFREDFSKWVRSTHEDSADFQKWYEKYQGDDFRSAVSTNINFLFKESIGVKDELRKHPVWCELLKKDIIPFQKVEQDQTIVTPYVYDCFKHLRFGQYLRPVTPSRDAHDRCPDVKIPRTNPLRNLHGSSVSTTRMAVGIPSAKDLAMERRRKTEAIKIGDVLSVTKDGESSVWKDEISPWKAADDCWYIYVQEVHDSKNNERSFGGIWLYKPSDTSCAKMKYPFPNELFLSDNCTCKQSRIEKEEIIDVVTVVWHGHPSECRDLFVRQTYLENDRFVTLKDAHKTCSHVRSQKETTTSKKCHKYPIGQTVLVAQTDLFPPRHTSKYGLDPYEIVKYENLNSKQCAILRCLLRRHEIDGQETCKRNELVYSNETVKVESRKIDRTCVVRFYNETDVANQTIPPPYNRDGTGNAFYITSSISVHTGKLSAIGAHPPRSLIQGFDPLQEPSREKLRGLDLYCGGGNFGRGLEEGQALRNEWAVDMDKIAMHTYFANLQDPQKTKLYYGSVNDQLFQAMQSNRTKSSLIPRPGDVDFISAGSPCQGFSNLNNNRSREAGLKNQSLIASVAAYVDFYRPKYGILENVLTMAQKDKGRDQDVLSQLICAIVGMGYQLSIFMLDAWSCGSSQSRSRIFVAFTASDYEPIPHPELSHSHPQHVFDRGVGQLANGKAFGERKRGPTPLNFVTASESVKNLPNIGNGATYSCISYPDHMTRFRLSNETRLQIAAIPIYPRDMNFWKAWNDGKGVMTKGQRALFPSSVNNVGKARESVSKGSKAWGRIDPNGFFSTITVAGHIQDSRTGRLLHWNQHRSLTVMEARRAQSFPDNEVIVGNPHQQFKIIGNSVDRCVALALGLSLRKAWEKNTPHDEAAGLSTPVKDKPIDSAQLQSLIKDEKGRFSNKTANCESSSATPPSDNTSPTSRTSDKATSRIALPSIESSPIVRDCHGQFARKRTEANRNEPIRPVPKPKANGIPSNRVIRDSYDSSDDEDFSENGRPLLNSTVLQAEPSPRWVKLLPSTEVQIPSLNTKPDTQPGSLKRSHVLIAPKIYTKEKNHKVPKISAAASPSSLNSAEKSSPSAIRKKESNKLQALRSQPLNATQLSQKPQLASTHHMANDMDHFAVEDDSDTTDFSSFTTSDDGSPEQPSQGDQENLLFSPGPKSLTLPPLMESPRVINASNREN